MPAASCLKPIHPVFTRRHALQAGAIGLLGLGQSDLAALRAAAPNEPKAKAVIYIFLSGGLAQHESFDLKPDAPDSIRGEFRPIATRTPGLSICEHLPLLAQRSHHFALVRSLTHPYNGHSEGHLAMLTGRTPLPPGFDPNTPRSSDWPSIAAVANYLAPAGNNLPPAVVLPHSLIHRTGRTIPGQFAGEMGPRWDPWLVKAASDCTSEGYGACPSCFRHDQLPHRHPTSLAFRSPNLTLPEGLTQERLSGRVNLLSLVDGQRAEWERLAVSEGLDHYREQAISLLAHVRTRRAFDVASADPKVQDRYGRNQFGWSLLLARRLVEAGVSLVQVNLGNNETWDTHQAMFPNLKDKLLPPTDRALAALLDDLHESGLLESTLIVMAGEFGRTPSISTLPGVKLPGRDPWGAVQTVFFAGGGIRGGTVIGLLRQERGVSRIQPANPRKHGCDYVPRPRYPQDCVLAGSIRPTALCLPRRASRWLGLAGQDHLSARPKVIFASRSSSHLMSRGQLLGFRLNEQRNVHERLYLDRRFLIDECDGGSCSR